MKGRCDICDKTVGFGHNVSHSNRKTNRMWRPNVQKAILLIKG
ncbi:MAG: bL28 family ribosomal protein, partial [Chloroflexota bacterium]